MDRPINNLIFFCIKMKRIFYSTENRPNETIHLDKGTIKTRRGYQKYNWLQGKDTTSDLAMGDKFPAGVKGWL